MRLRLDKDGSPAAPDEPWHWIVCERRVIGVRIRSDLEDDRHAVFIKYFHKIADARVFVGARAKLAGGVNCAS